AIATVIKGKGMGAESLIEIFSSRPDSFLMLSSSVNGYFGGFKAGAYSAANAYLDALPSAIGENGPKIYSISWTQWEEIGMNKDSLLVELSKAKGFMSISASQGMASLLATLCQSSGNMIVGLNPNKHYVASHM
ncbi:KR domain-containing protein, partial [Bacillus cereus]|uniref:KR domain-containing protein n=1 Tax=Bacillus cereus TaxID=1396 RepID=UPI0018F70DFF|nr:KR domain-containing protein [Bacillus cereus]